MEDCGNYGARIERGEIIEARGELPGREYRVKSLSRDGVMTPFIRAICGAECWDQFEADAGVHVKCKRKYETGQKVYYFMFDDGHGRILAEMD